MKHFMRNAIAAIFPLFFMTGCDEEANAPREAELPEVSILEMSPQPLVLTRQLQGRTSAPEIAEVRPQVNGIIHAKLFTEGSMVKEGQPLFQLETEVYASQLEQYVANLAVARSAQTAAWSKLNRAKKIITQHYISQQDYDDLNAAYQQAVANVKASEAQVKIARINLKYTTIVAPISGQIGRSNITVGALVTANQTDPLVTIQKINPIYFDFSQSGEDFLQLRREVDAGSVNAIPINVHMFLHDGTQYEQQGKLQFADATIDESTGSVSLRASFPNNKNYLIPGMFVRAQVDVGRRQNGFLIPQNLISRAANGDASVLAVNEKNQITSLPLSLGRTVGNHFIVESGILGGERVIKEGASGLESGTEVAIKAPSEKE